MKAAAFPGSSDPVTLGHLDIIEHASRLSDRLIVAIPEDSEKHTTFSMEERLTFLRSNTAHFSNVEVVADRDLTVDSARKQEAAAIMRGVRSVKDYEYELDIVSVNRHIASEVETVLLYASPELSYVFNPIIWGLVEYGQDVSTYVLKDVMGVFVNK